MVSIENLDKDFTAFFGSPPELIARAPGRVNLIGEHTDYNDGWVLPVAINFENRVAVSKRTDGQIRLFSVNYKQEDSFEPHNIDHAVPDRLWADYIRGVVSVLKNEGHDLGGMDIAISGNVPFGSGLSSSAALELSTILALTSLNGIEMSMVEAALLSQKAENRFVGMNCGIMDQLISALGQTDHALLIDCRSLQHQPVPLPAGIKVVITNSGVKRGLVDSAYNERRNQCETGAKLLGIESLRDISYEEFMERQNSLPTLIAKRCMHVVSENRRVLEFVESLHQKNLHKMGELMIDSHQSLRDLYEVSIPELDLLVDIQKSAKGCYGVRLTGAGFGGCTVALMAQDRLDNVVTKIKSDYSRQTGIDPDIYICQAVNGASLI